MNTYDVMKAMDGHNAENILMGLLAGVQLAKKIEKRLVL